MPGASTAPSRARLVAGLILGIVSISCASVLIRGLSFGGVPLLTVAFYRMLIATAILAVAAIVRRERLSPFEHAPVLLFSGVCLAIHFALWTMSFAYIPVARSVLVVSSQTIFVVIASAIFLREVPTRRVVLGVALAIAGVAIVSSEGLVRAGEGAWRGDLLALGGAIAVVGYILSGRYLRAKLGLLGYVIPVYVVATAGLLVLCLATGAGLTGFPARAWVGMVLLAIIPTIFGHTVFNWLLGYLRADSVSVAMLAEPVGAAILAFIFFAEIPSAWTLAGAPLILSGLALASLAGSETQSPPTTTQDHQQ